LERQVRADEGQRPRLVRSLEDGPFYARALVETRLAGLPALAMHETLAAERLRRGWVRFLTAFRMRRET
jgi:carotenoid 1,2-hydratase